MQDMLRKMEVMGILYVQTNKHSPEGKAPERSTCTSRSMLEY